MELLLKVHTEICRQLSKSIARSMPYTWVGVLQVRDNKLDDVRQYIHHLLDTSLRNGRDRHQRRMTILPVR